MILSLKQPYKSLQPFISEDLDDFTIITGKNGSGKSQLLSRINPQGNQEAHIKTEIFPPLSKIQKEGIIKAGNLQINHQGWSQIIQQRANTYKSLSPALKKLFKFIGDNNLDINNYQKKILLSDKAEYLALITEAERQRTNVQSGPGQRQPINIQSTVLHQQFSEGNTWVFKLISDLCKMTGKNEEELTELDFFKNPIQEHLIDSNDLFSSQVEMVFYNYAKRRDTNQRNYFAKKEYGTDNNSISDNDFIKEFTPPWEIINSIFEVHKVDFIFKEIGREEFSSDVPMDFNLIKKSTSKIIPFNDLSSGEKVIVGLILKLFTSEYYGKSLSLPELLILDEPDAHLHPQMSKLLLDVLEQTFVNRYGIKVIISTHSPSTIALADEKHIYELTNGMNTSLKKISKDDALQILTGFIPTLSIDYKNHRQIFVESPTDLNYYQTLHNKRAQEIIPIHNLYFISNSLGKGNCDLVYATVKQIIDSGSHTAYGIVDWDLKNEATNHVLVHGAGERYSVENFLLDPIYVLCLLINNNVNNIMSQIGIDGTYNQYSFGNESPERIQSLVEFYFTEFEKRFPAHKYQSTKIPIRYLNGHAIEIPEWYLRMQGHKIVEKIKEVFPGLGSIPKFRDEGNMQRDLIFIMAKFYPFVPLTSIELIDELTGTSANL